MISNRQALFECLEKLTNNPYFIDLPSELMKKMRIFFADTIGVKEEMDNTFYKYKIYQLALLFYQYKRTSDKAIKYWHAVKKILAEYGDEMDLPDFVGYYPKVIFYYLLKLNGCNTKKFPDDWFDFSFNYAGLANKIHLTLYNSDLLTKINWQLIVDHAPLMSHALCEPCSQEDKMPKIMRILRGVDEIIGKISEEKEGEDERMMIGRQEVFAFLLHHFDIVIKIIKELNLNNPQLVNKEMWEYILSHGMQLSELLKTIEFLSTAKRLNQFNIDILFKRYNKCLDSLVNILKQYDPLNISEEAFKRILQRPLSLLDSCRSIFAPYVNKHLLDYPQSMMNVAEVHHKLS